MAFAKGFMIHSRCPNFSDVCFLIISLHMQSMSISCQNMWSKRGIKLSSKLDLCIKWDSGQVTAEGIVLRKKIFFFVQRICDSVLSRRCPTKL